MTSPQGLLGCVDPFTRSPIPPALRVELYGRIMLYVFGGCKQPTVKRFMLTLPFDYPGWKKALRSNGSVYKNSKLYIYSQVVSPIGPKDAEISLKEANALKLALQYRPLRDYLNTLAANRRSPLSLAKIDAYFGLVLTSADLRQYTARFTYKKLRFLAQSYGMSLQDLQSTLINAAYTSLLKQYPNFENFAHLTKLAKATIHNCGINIIKKQTSLKRNVLEQNSDGTYYANTSSLTDDGQSAASIGEEGYTLTSYLVTGIDGAVFSQWERTFSLRQLLSGSKLTDTQKKFLRLMLGENSEEFANFMERSPADLYERNFEEYQKQVCAYLRISTEKGKRFLSSLQQFL